MSYFCLSKNPLLSLSGSCAPLWEYPDLYVSLPNPSLVFGPSRRSFVFVNLFSPFLVIPVVHPFFVFFEGYPFPSRFSPGTYPFVRTERRTRPQRAPLRSFSCHPFLSLIRPAVSRRDPLCSVGTPFRSFHSHVPVATLLSALVLHVFRPPPGSPGKRKTPFLIIGLSSLSAIPRIDAL